MVFGAGVFQMRPPDFHAVRRGVRSEPWSRPDSKMDLFCLVAQNETRTYGAHRRPRTDPWAATDSPAYSGMVVSVFTGVPTSADTIVDISCGSDARRLVVTWWWRRYKRTRGRNAERMTPSTKERDRVQQPRDRPRSTTTTTTTTKTMHRRATLRKHGL